MGCIVSSLQTMLCGRPLLVPVTAGRYDLSCRLSLCLLVRRRKNLPRRHAAASTHLLRGIVCVCIAVLVLCSVYYSRTAFLTVIGVNVLRR